MIPAGVSGGSPSLGLYTGEKQEGENMEWWLSIPIIRVKHKRMTKYSILKHKSRNVTCCSWRIWMFRPLEWVEVLSAPGTIQLLAPCSAEGYGTCWNGSYIRWFVYINTTREIVTIAFVIWIKRTINYHWYQKKKQVPTQLCLCVADQPTVSRSGPSSSQFLSGLDMPSCRNAQEFLFEIWDSFHDPVKIMRRLLFTSMKCKRLTLESFQHE